MSQSDFLRLRFDTFELDEADARLTRDGQPIALAPKTFAVLCALARQPRLLMTKNALLDTVWGHQFVSESVLKTTISELRAALQDDARKPRYIETVSRRGYRFIAGVSPLSMPAATASPTPSAATARSIQASPITGRSDALVRLRASWELACAGKRQVVWIAGEAGIGKTTLIEHFISALGEICCAHGQCVEQYGAGEPYLPILEALAELCRRDAALPPLLRSAAPTWLLQLPWLSSAAEREALRRELAGAHQARMLREMGEMLDRYTEHKPLLLVTEDLHWSDHATVQLMDHIARRRGGARLMWLASFRLVEIIAADHPLKALRHELRLHGLCEEIVLDPFSEKEVADYIAERVSGFEVDEAFVRALHARTDGLPLFVTDVINDLIAHGELGVGGEPSARLRLASMAIPQNLAGIIDQYIRRLTPEQRALLDAASVCGVEFRPGTVADALGRDLAGVAESCDELARRQQWLSDAAVDARGGVLDAGYAFRHALYRQVLYERIGPLARAQLHRKVGASLERDRAAGLAVTAAELASHFDLGREPMTALRYYAEAAESALRHFSPAEAMSLTERALALLVQAEAGMARTTLEITLATLQGVSAEHLLGIGSIEAKRAFERAQALLDDVPQHPLSGLLLRGLGMVHVMRGEYSEALALAERSAALSLATQDPILLLCACSVQGNVQTLQGRPRIAREWLERGVVASDALGEATLVTTFITDPGVMLLAMFSVPLLYLGFVDQARARLQAAHARARHLAQPMAQAAAIWFDALFEVRMGNAQRVRDLAEQMRAIVDDSALAQARAAHRWFRGWAQAQLGDPREGYRLIREGYEENVRLGMLSGASEMLGYAAEALVLAGDWSAARQQLDEAMQMADTLGERVYLPQLLLLEARIADARREPARAREWIRQALAEARAQEARWLELTALLALCEREDATAEDVQALASLIDQLTEGLDTAPVARARALLGAAHAA